MDLITVLTALLATGIPFLAIGLKWELGWPAILKRFPVFAGINILVSYTLHPDPVVTVLVCFVLLGLEVPLSILPFFFRDPERSPPADPLLLVSPADGHVVYVKKISEGSIPLCSKKGIDFSPEELSGIEGLTREGFLVGIGMTFLDVHVTRVPVSGKITHLKHLPGRFISLKDPEAVIRNERVSIVVEGENTLIAFILIASRLVRRIVSYVSEGDTVQRGDRVGMIKFGSQVDVIIPLDSIDELLVKPGDILKAGESPVALLKKKRTGQD